MKTEELEKLPTEFRGVAWSAGWDFDMPCVVYHPRKYMEAGYGGSSGQLESMMEDICIDISLGEPHRDGGLDKECEWRGWSKRGFAKRKNAQHVVIRLTWQLDKEGNPEPTTWEKSETWGPPPDK